MLPLYLLTSAILCYITWQIHPTLSAVTFIILLVSFILLRDKLIK